MLKLFYKTLLVSLLSVSLLLLNFQFDGLIFEIKFNSAKAVTTTDVNTTPTVTPPPTVTPVTPTPVDTANINTVPATQTTTVVTTPSAADSTTPVIPPDTQVQAASTSAAVAAETKPATSAAPTPAPVANTNAAASGPAEKLKLDAVTDSGMMATLTMIAIAVVVIRLFKCKWTTDMMVAIAAGVIFLAGEVIAAFKLSKAMKDQEVEIKRDDKGQIDQKQIETLQSLKKSYEEAKKTASFKKTLQMAAAAAFAIAAIIAGVNYLTETVAEKACTAALVTSATACISAGNAAAASVGGAAAAPPLLAGGAAANTAAATNETISAAAIVPGPSAGHETADLAASTAHTASVASATASCPLVTPAGVTCVNAKAIKMLTKGFCLVPPSVPVASLSEILGKPLYAEINYTPIKKVSLMTDFFQNIFISKAEAGIFSLMGIASAAAVAFLFMMSATLGMKLDIMLFSPQNRAMIWAAFGVLTYMAISATSDQIKKIEDNIKKIDDILKSMGALENGVVANNASAVPTAAGANNKINETSIKAGNDKTEQAIGNHNLSADGTPEDINLTTNGKPNSLPCVTGDNTANCESFSSKINLQNDLKNLPDNIQGQIGIVGKLTDGLSGRSRITGETINIASNLAGQQKALANILKKQRVDLQKALDENGSKINLDNETKAITASLLAATKKELDARKTTARGMLASINGSMGGGSGGAITSGNDASKKATDGFGAFVMPPMPTMPSMPSIPSNDLKRDNDGAKEDAPVGVNKTKTATMDDYDLKNDITQDKGASIFELISNRYHKSMERLFLRKN